MKRSDVFIVMRSKVRCIIDGSVGWEWFIISSPLVRESAAVSRREALEFIDSHGLVEVLRTSDGSIWDTPDRAFRSRWKGILSSSYGKITRIWGQ